jgi:excisionase family DNA binding protein
MTDRTRNPYQHSLPSHCPHPYFATINETCAVLRLGRSKIYELIAQGKLSMVKIGRSTRIRWSDIERFAAASV